MIRRINCILTIILALWAAPVVSQEKDSLDNLIKKLEDSLLGSFQFVPDDQVLEMIDKSWSDVYNKTFISSTYKLAESDTQKIVFSTELNDAEIAARIASLDKMTPFELTYNAHIKAFIQLYLFRKREVTEKILGLAPYYYPIFEQELAKQNLPLELKYLPIVESALNPRAKSRAGAMGLWQFMYHTGKMYGLNVNSYYDERMDPLLATEAAVKYLGNLYKLYNDWNLVIAAYNCGPGNVNKAIRRSGGKRDFWEISKYLPRETRGYVPAFMAVNYVMNYPGEHELRMTKPEQDLYPTDTVYVCHQVTFEAVSKTLKISEDWLRYFNPMYRLDRIPESDKKLSICLPVDKIGAFMINEDSIYSFYNKREALMQESGIAEARPQPVKDEIVHRVRSGEVLGLIARKYNCSVTDIKEWNNLRSTNIYPGQRLKIYADRSAAPATGSSTEAKTAQAAATPAPKKDETIISGKYQYHIIQPGDTLWDIAKKYKEVTVNDLKRLNSDLDFKKLKPGDKIKVQKVG